MAGRDGIDDVNFSDSELVYHIRDALRLVPLGESDSYNQLIGVLHHTERLTTYEVALLVIFGMNMWNYGPDVMDALIELIISLAASNGKYVDSCLHMLVSNFTPPYSFPELLKQPCVVARKNQVLHRVHSALKDIADLVPLAPLKLQDIIIQRMPNIYTKETVEIVLDDILQDDSSKGIFEMELEEVEGTADYARKDSDELLVESLNENFFVGDIFAEKLDSLMVLIFEHLKSCIEGGRLIEVFGTLLQSFQKTVMNTYKSKFAQVITLDRTCLRIMDKTIIPLVPTGQWRHGAFVMFFACSLDPENCGVKFANMLADIFMGGQSPLDRMSAVAYLASYLSRAKFSSASFVAIILKRLVDWCSEYCQIHDGDTNPEAHRIFYSGCQAFMYVRCFHMRSMTDVPPLKSQLLFMPIESILKHPLNPLKVCLPSIVQEFLRQAKASHLFTVSESFMFDDLLESEFSRAFGGIERLDKI